jgi:pimeloyl-ACP methyl ester carboxylesterase
MESRPARDRSVLAVLVAAGALAGCASLLPAPAPMHSRSNRVSPTAKARCLMVLLPGLGDSDADFADHGFIAELRARKLSVDTVSANAKLGYYARGTLGARIDADILAPNTAGYEQVWVTGISMGGMGTLLTAQRHPELAGLVLIAPFLGDSDLITEITVAGGLAKWKAPPKPAVQNGDNYQRDTWRWLQLAVANPTTPPAIYILSGDQDPAMRAHRLLASNLPAERVFRVKGDHDWGPWKRLWADFLDRSDFAARCAAP